jgi:hypothetical protein
MGLHNPGSVTWRMGDAKGAEELPPRAWTSA